MTGSRKQTGGEAGSAVLQVEVAERRLPSGLTLLAVRNPAVRTFAAIASLRVNGRCEKPEQEGIAYLTGSCLDEGTSKRDAEALAAAAEDLGASLDAHSDGAALQCPAEVAPKALGLLREILVEPTFPDREVRRVQQEILVQVRNDQSDAGTVAQQMFRKGVYGRHRNARPAYGTAEQIEHFRPTDLRRFHARWFVPEEGVVAAAGPGDPEETLDLLQRSLRGFRGELPQIPEQPSPPTPKPRVVSRRMAREQVHVFLGHLGIRRDDPDFHRLLVMDNVLGAGAGFTSRISQRLRDEEGLCYSVHASITATAGKEQGTFSAYIGTSPAHREAAIAGFRQEIERLRAEPPTDEEVADAISFLTGSYAFGLQRSAGLARYALLCKRFDLGFDYAQRRQDEVGAVTPEDVRAVAERHLDPVNVVVASAGAQ